MKPSRLKTGDRIIIADFGANSRVAFFVERAPAECGRPALNVLRFPDFEALDGPDDKCLCTMTDHELIKRGELANAKEKNAPAR